MNLRDSWNHLVAERPSLAAVPEDIQLAHHLADLVVDARVGAGLSQERFGKLAGTTQARISEIEAGVGNPTLDTLGRVLGVVSQLSTQQLAVTVEATAIVTAEPETILGTMTRVDFNVDQVTYSGPVETKALAASSELAVAA